MKRYILILECGEKVWFHEGDLPSDILPMADDGILDVLDITEPSRPLRYLNKYRWIHLDALSS